ncbi:hypothetical protein GGF32_007899 [Allomyces javanicus]|nr:hypothetical protein GGF32_007899 [Allomyces javanicus]
MPKPAAAASAIPHHRLRDAPPRSKRQQPTPTRPLIDRIPDREAQRLARESGVFAQLDRAHALRSAPVGGALVSQTVLYTVLLVGAYAGIEVLVYQQFFEDHLWQHVFTRLWKETMVGPALAVLVYLTHGYVHVRGVQWGMAAGVVAIMTVMMRTIIARSALGEMLKVPGMAVVALYFIAQLRLTLVLAALAASAASYGLLALVKPL